MTAGVKGRRWSAAEGDVNESDAAKAGDFQFHGVDYGPTDTPCGDADRQGRLAYRCPRTGQPCGEIIIGKEHKPQLGCPTWQWDGNLEAPTLTPSINCRGCWHGYLRAGIFEEC